MSAKWRTYIIEVDMTSVTETVEGELSHLEDDPLLDLQPM